jgi:hypothetical protein
LNSLKSGHYAFWGKSSFMVQRFAPTLTSFSALGLATLKALRLAKIGVVAVTVLAASSAQAAVLYQLDDGKSEAAVGISDRINSQTGKCVLDTGTPVADFLWLNEFDVTERASLIDTISVAWGSPNVTDPCTKQSLPTSGLTENLAAKVLLYEDRNGDGKLELLTQQDTTVQNPGTDSFFDVKLNRPTQIQGRKFYVGALLPGQLQGQFPAALDSRNRAGEPDALGKSYIAFNLFFPERSTFDYSEITPVLYMQPDENGKRVPAGNFLLRASGTKPVPEPSAAIGLLTLGAGAWMLKKRKNSV